MLTLKKRKLINMILIGELEYTNQMMAPDGNTGFLFVSTENLTNGIGYSYAISPYEENPHVGQKEIFDKPLSITEYLQHVVNSDIYIGGGSGIAFKDDVGIRLKGMEEWITRTSKNEHHEQ